MDEDDYELKKHRDEDKWGYEPRDHMSNVDWNYMMAGHDPYKNDKGEWVPCDCMACEKRYG